ncbi:hypothetical protein PIB30_001422 [Stylosanthes scabra]|uniref:Uncharacterized protein n=1 Tax=Stylosanthes scabra TaxID=79078 RepID=A0ABU6Z0S3_9FABA|nr:hypothetical protein [Stylosanthes scabra]
MAEVRGDGPGGVVREVEGAQIPHELNPLYSWATRDVLGSPSTITEDYLKELKESGVICGGGEEEGNYRVELPRRGERICELNLDHLRVPHWLWVNEVMLTEFGVHIPFTSFQQRLLQRCFVTPSQFHSNAWSAIRCFELLKTTHDAHASPVSCHPPFWLTLERGAGHFPSYWSKDAGLNYTPVSYRTLNDEQRDTADVLLWLFSKRPLKPKAVLGNPEYAREAIVKMAGKNKTMSQLRRVMQANPQGLIVLSQSGGHVSSSAPEGGSSMNVEEGIEDRVVSSPIQEEGPEVAVEVPPVSMAKKLGNDEGTSTQKRTRLSEGSQRDFCPMDRSFDATGFIESNLLTPGAREILQDHDPMESLRWA